MTANEQVELVRAFLRRYDKGKMRWAEMVLAVIAVLLDGHPIPAPDPADFKD